MAQDTSRIGTTQSVAFDGSTAIGNAFGAQTRKIRLAANAACNYKIGDGAQTAASTDPFLPANFIEYVGVQPGQRLSAIASPSDGLVTSTAGTLWVTELD